MTGVNKIGQTEIGKSMKYDCTVIKDDVYCLLTSNVLFNDIFLWIHFFGVFASSTHLAWHAYCVSGTGHIGNFDTRQKSPRRCLVSKSCRTRDTSFASRDRTCSTEEFSRDKMDVAQMQKKTDWGRIVTCHVLLFLRMSCSSLRWRDADFSS